MTNSPNLKHAIVASARRLREGARLMIGVPDYDTYVAHMREAHPDRPAMTYAEFFRERQAARYGEGTSTRGFSAAADPDEGRAASGGGPRGLCLAALHATIPVRVGSGAPGNRPRRSIARSPSSGWEASERIGRIAVADP